MSKPAFILFFDEIGIEDISKVGGKNASLGEMYNQLTPQGIGIPNGFALTADAYRLFCKTNKLDKPLNDLLLSLDTKHYSNIKAIGEDARDLIMDAKIPQEIIEKLNEAYQKLSTDCGLKKLDVAVRSSATAEDLPSASFAGRMESFLNIKGEEQLLDAVHRCYASLFTDRAIKYRHDMGFTGIDVAISVGIQQMVRSDKAV
jgi:pyruvate,water dikinase